MVKIRMLFVLIVLASALFFGCTSSGNGQNSEKPKAIVYKTSSCGCCSEYTTYLRSKGFDVEVVNLADISSIKQQYGVPINMQSCHTTVLGGYFVEGHVPIEAIDRLLSEKPAIDGIALPKMPSGSPGMPGSQTQPFAIYSITKGKTSEFMVLN